SDPMPMLKEFAAGMRCGKNVRGAMVGRNVLFPGDDDPLVMAHAVSAIIYDGAEPEAALRLSDEVRNTDLDALTKYL
ncbi:MAG TPA: hypothetical protein VNO70_01365, partial [Blastocatellia bacterium]|nr:hypothetical protein [Blastocatellia bacterium]